MGAVIQKFIAHEDGKLLSTRTNVVAAEIKVSISEEVFKACDSICCDPRQIPRC